MIIGVTGLFSSGKDTVADYLISKGFIHISLADILREKARAQNIDSTRENLIALKNKLVKEIGYDFLAKEALERATKKSVLTSIRNPAEVDYLKKNSSFKMITVYCPVEVRYERAKKRNRYGEMASSLEEFVTTENKEQIKGSGLDLNSVIEKADYTIHNTKDLPYLYQQVDELLAKINEI